MRPGNVFSPSFGNRPSYLVGRDQVIQGFLNGLSTEPGDRNRAIVLLGQRGSGKTVLLWELADRAASMGFAVATPTIASEGILERIVEKIQDNGSRYIKTKEGVRLSGGSIGALGFSAGLEFDREMQETKSLPFKLTQLARRLTESGHGVLILVDELQANSTEVRQLVATYQEMVGERLNVAIVLAGLPGAVSQTLNDRVLTFLNRARKVTLGPLKIAEVDAFYQHAFEELEIGIDRQQRLRAAKATMGSPYLLQLIGYNLTMKVEAGGSVDASALDEAIEASLLDFENDVCRTTVAALSDRDIDFLQAMLPDTGPSKMSDVSVRMDATSDYAQKYRRRLLDAGVIQVARRGYVEYAVPYLKRFLQRQADEF